MITDKIIRGAGSHRILLALIERSRTSKELRRLVGAVNSTKKFEGEYMARLEANGYVFAVEGRWSITVKGTQKCESLGLPKLGGVAGPRVLIESRTLPTSIWERAPAPRPGSLDFLEFPSRRGNRLYYRDGRIEIVEG